MSVKYNAAELSGLYWQGRINTEQFLRGLHRILLRPNGVNTATGKITSYFVGSCGFIDVGRKQEIHFTRNVLTPQESQRSLKVGDYVVVKWYGREAVVVKRDERTRTLEHQRRQLTSLIDCDMPALEEQSVDLQRDFSAEHRKHHLLCHCIYTRYLLQGSLSHWIFGLAVTMLNCLVFLARAVLVAINAVYMCLVFLARAVLLAINAVYKFICNVLGCVQRWLGVCLHTALACSLRMIFNPRTMLVIFGLILNVLLYDDSIFLECTANTSTSWFQHIRDRDTSYRNYLLEEGPASNGPILDVQDLFNAQHVAGYLESHLQRKKSKEDQRGALSEQFNERANHVRQNVHEQGQTENVHQEGQTENVHQQERREEDVGHEEGCTAVVRHGTYVVARSIGILLLSQSLSVAMRPYLRRSYPVVFAS
eukprot:747097-Hanusia_phi.AAC.5